MMLTVFGVFRYVYPSGCNHVCLSSSSELLGTPGYLAPEMLKMSVEADAEGYNKEIDMCVRSVCKPSHMFVTCLSPDLSQVGMWSNHVHSVSSQD